MWKETKREATVTTACSQGLERLKANVVFQLYDSQRQSQCEGPVQNPKTPSEFSIRCNGTQLWMDACSTAGGDVCAMNAQGHGRYGGEVDEHDYIVYSLLCVPLACKKDENINDYIWEQTKVWCPTYGFKACKMSVNCGHVPSSMTAPIVLALLGFLVLIGGILAVVYLVYTRYYANRVQPDASEPSSAFSEYSELAQYEEDDVEIHDSSIGEDVNDEEEDQPLH